MRDRSGDLEQPQPRRPAGDHGPKLLRRAQREVDRLADESALLSCLAADLETAAQGHADRAADTAALLHQVTAAVAQGAEILQEADASATLAAEAVLEAERRGTPALHAVDGSGHSRPLPSRQAVVQALVHAAGERATLVACFLSDVAGAEVAQRGAIARLDHLVSVSSVEARRLAARSSRVASAASDTRACVSALQELLARAQPPAAPGSAE